MCVLVPTVVMEMEHILMRDMIICVRGLDINAFSVCYIILLKSIYIISYMIGIIMRKLKNKIS